MSYSINSAYLIFIVKGLGSPHAVSCKKPLTSEYILFLFIPHDDICKL